MASVIEPTTSPAAPSLDPAAVVKMVLKALASLQLTVALLALSVVLVFFGTLAQKTDGIWTVVDKFFHPMAFVSWVEFQHLVHFGQIFLGLPAGWTVGGRFPIPGGGLIGWLMFLNLLAAHAVRFKLTWKRAGVYVLHTGLLLLFVGEYVTRVWQVEQQMTIGTGQSVNLAVDTRNFEVAFVRPDGDADKVTAVPVKRLARGGRVSHPELPVDVELVSFYPNSTLEKADDSKPNPATAGAGQTDVAVNQPEISGVDNSNRANIPSAYVRLFDKQSGAELGVWLVSQFLKPQPLPGEAGTLLLRPVHYYKPYTLTLTKFDFEQYTGTGIAKNYASHLTLTDPDRGPDRQVVVSMNEPLRYRGETYYQHQFSQTPAGGRTTTLQVVRNPGWLLPYISCVMVGGGMLAHFLIGLWGFIKRTSAGPAAGKRTWLRAVAVPAPTNLTERLIPWLAVGLAALLLLVTATMRTSDGPLDLRGVSRLPVVDGGRVKPLDTVARVNLRLISHRETYKDKDDQTRSAIHWFMESAAADDLDDSAVAKAPVFRIENDRLIELLGQKPRDGLRYSFAELRPKLKELFEAAKKARQLDDAQREPFDAKVLELAKHLDLMFAVYTGQTPLVLPPEANHDWRSRYDGGQEAEARLLTRMAEQFGRRFQSMAEIRSTLMQIEDKEQRKQVAAGLDKLLREVEAEDKALLAWNNVIKAYQSGEQKRLDEAVAEYAERTAGKIPDADQAKARFEGFLNDTALFYNIEFLYLLAFLLTLGGWATQMFNPSLGEAWRKAAFWVLVLTLAVHTFTLFGRMYLMGRPLVFVTNLYSSAVFIGWGAVGLCLAIEWLFPLGLGNKVAAVAGGATAIIAHNLAVGGDTLEMMQAVLDTNFWLATHVTTVTLGYSATYVAGLIGLVYLAAGMFTPVLRKPFELGTGDRRTTLEVGRAIGMVLYGVVCFAALLSFVGTVLGGIWADQSWGRFWGWDPKENGAVLIVCWNALILHARWCGLVKDRGMAVLALGGNMITTWSWFGTNQLGVGLHAYGFSNKLAFGCTVTWFIHLGLIAAGLVPKRLWVSYAPSRAG